MVNTAPTHPRLSRRRLLTLLTAASVTGLTASGGFALYESAPWLSYDQLVASTRRPFETVTAVATQRREVVRYATLAASGHNTQPWRFTLHEQAIAIQPDYGRRLPVVDPADRELWISLGCALENLLIAARDRPGSRGDLPRRDRDDPDPSLGRRPPGESLVRRHPAPPDHPFGV